MLRRKKCKTFTQTDSEYEICVLCGCITDIPKSMPLQMREGYLQGAGQLYRACAIKNIAEEQVARQKDFVYGLPVNEEKEGKLW